MAGCREAAASTDPGLTTDGEVAMVDVAWEVLDGEMVQEAQEVAPGRPFKAAA